MADLMGDDPVADFLQHEHDQLRELGIDDAQFDQPVDDSEGDFEADYSEVVHLSRGHGQGLVNGYNNAQGASMGGPIPSSAPLVEPESIRRWREEKTRQLADMDEREHSDRQVWLDRARKELDDWHARYREQLEKVFHENRTSQAQFLEEMRDTKPGNEWEKAARFCDFNPKSSKNTKDTSRMRSLLLQLKQTPLER